MIRAVSWFIMVADFGQPNRTESGLYISNPYFGSEWRYGEVISVGPGRLIEGGEREAMPDLKVGDYVLFSRKHGTRTGYRHVCAKYPGGRLIRVLDPMKTVAVVTDFEPWWGVEETQLNIAGELTG